MVEMRALIDRSGYFNPVENYYNQFSYDLTASHEKIVIPPAQTMRIRTRSIQDLIDALKRYGLRGEKSFLIGTHGNPNGLPLRIRPGNPVTFNADIILDICRALENNEQARDDLLNMTSLAGGGKVFPNAARLDALLDDIRMIRGFRLDTLEFRGCNIGAGPALRALHKLFGARITDGPRVRFFWTTMATNRIRNIDDATFTQRMASLGPDQRVFTDVDCYRGSTLSGGAGPAMPAVGIGLTGPHTIRLEARSRDMLKGFAEAQLQDPILFALGQNPAGGGYRPGGRISIIGFLTPNAQQPYVIVGDGFGYTNFIKREINPVPVNLP